MYNFLFYVRTEQYNVDPDSITVSGLSSGGAMAMQFHIAFSSYVKGSGVLAGSNKTVFVYFCTLLYCH